MSRTLKVYNGEDQSPITDITDMVEWPEAEFGQRAHQGESTLSNIRFRDEDGRVGDSSGLPAGLTPISLNAHNVVIWTESGQTMGRMRISPKDWTRGAQVGGRAREAQVTLEDYNSDLRNIVVHNYSRPAETDKARVQGLLATYLSGSPRRTTNLNGSNYVSSSNTVTLPATTYNRTTAAEVLASIAATANKLYFVTIDASLFYDGNDSTVYASTLKISDRDTDLSSTVLAPQPGGFGPASSEDGQQLLSGVWLFYGDTQYVHVTNPTVANQNSWWEDVVYDDTVTTAAQATVVANALLAQRQVEERQIAVRIGPLTYGQAIQIKAGQLIQIKWRAIPHADDAYVSRRITELRWSTPEPFSFFADMILDRPTRLHGQGQKTDTVIPKSAPVPIQDTLGTDLYRWSFTTNANDDATNTYNSGLFRVINGGFLSHPPADAAFGAFYAKNKAGYFISVAIPVSALTSYTFGTDILWQYDPSIRNVDIRWVNGTGTVLREDRWITGSGHALDTEYTETATFTSPAGTTDVKFYWTSFAGTYIDNLVITGSGTAAADDPYALAQPGSSPYYARSDDLRFDADDQHLISRLTRRMTNNSGVTLADGDVVVPDLTLTNAVTRTTSANTTASMVGVVIKGGAAGAEVMVMWQGNIVSVACTDTTPTAGDYLFSSTTAGQSQTSATRAAGAVGRIISVVSTDQTAVLWWGVPDSAAAAALIVQEDDVTVDAAVSTLDFTTALNVTSSPAGEANVAVDLGTGATQAAAGNHSHTAGDSAKASGTGDITTTTTAADCTGATLSLVAGTYIVVGAFDVTRAGATNDRTFEGVLDVGGTDENDLASWTPLGAVLARAPVVQSWRVVLASTTTVKLQARHLGGTLGDFTVNGANTTIAAFTSGGGAALGVWTDYTPTLTATTTNPTIGNGTLTGRYKMLDTKTYAIQIRWVFGSTSAAGSGSYIFALPAGLTSGAVGQVLAGFMDDSSTNKYTLSGYIPAAQTTVTRSYHSLDTSGTGILASASPVTWATGDAVTLTGTIEVA